MPLPLLAAAGISLAPSIFKLFKGSGQGNTPIPNDPGYQINNDIIDNSRILGEQYSNYQLPGYNQIMQNTNNNYNSAFNQGVQGATSGGDVLDLANKLAYGKQQSINQLGITAANAKQTALANYLNSKVAAGQEYQNKNAYERQKYQQALQARAAKQQAGAENTFGALDDIASVGAKFLSPTQSLVPPGLDTTAPAYNSYLDQLKQQAAQRQLLAGIGNTEQQFNSYLGR